MSADVSAPGRPTINFHFETALNLALVTSAVETMIFFLAKVHGQPVLRHGQSFTRNSRFQRTLGGSARTGQGLHLLRFGMSPYRPSAPVARGGPQRRIGGSAVHHAGLNKRRRLAGPSVPSLATPNSWFAFTPRRSQRVERRRRMCRSRPTLKTTNRAAVLLIETDSISLIGPTAQHATHGPIQDIS